MYRLTVEKFLEQKTPTLEDCKSMQQRYLGGVGVKRFQEGFKQWFLTIDLTDEEFAAVKKAVLGVM